MQVQFVNSNRLLIRVPPRLVIPLTVQEVRLDTRDSKVPGIFAVDEKDAWRKDFGRGDQYLPMRFLVLDYAGATHARCAWGYPTSIQVDASLFIKDAEPDKARKLQLAHHHLARHTVTPQVFVVENCQHPSMPHMVASLPPDKSADQGYLVTFRLVTSTDEEQLAQVTWFRLEDMAKLSPALTPAVSENA